MSSWSWSAYGAYSCADASPCVNAAATSVARMRRFMEVPCRSLEEAHGDGLAVRGIEHFGAHRLAGPLGRDGQAPIGEQGAREFGFDHGGAGLERHAFHRA